MKNKAMENRLSTELMDFIHSRRSLQLATVDEDGVPFASYAPFAADNESFFVLLSDIALHGINLAREPRASVLLIEDEDTADELFARLRVSYQVCAKEVDANTPEWHRGVDLLAARHGERPRKLSQLSDFRLFRLHALKGRYVKGFGKAYRLAGGRLGTEGIDHLREGHKLRQEQAA